MCLVERSGLTMLIRGGGFDGVQREVPIDMRTFWGQGFVARPVEGGGK
jgi:hypothetical protein